MIKFTINNQSMSFDGDLTMPLLWFLRDIAGLTGTKYGCGLAMCGACTVHIDNKPVRSCSITMADMQGKQITTIENIFTNATAQAVQDAWRNHQVVQCGYCQSGQMMSAIALLNQKPNPTDDDINMAMSGNVCRCGTYVRIKAAIHDAAKIINAQKASSPPT